MSDPSNEQPAAVRVCCVCPAVTPACRIARIIPRRDVPPLSDDVRRATAWPDSANPVDVAVCSRRPCWEAVRAAAVSVLSVTALGDETAVRVVKEDA